MYDQSIIECEGTVCGPNEGNGPRTYRSPPLTWLTDMNNNDRHTSTILTYTHAHTSAAHWNEISLNVEKLFPKHTLSCSLILTCSSDVEDQSALYRYAEQTIA